jgi:MscS family membrane protein
MNEVSELLKIDFLGIQNWKWLTLFLTIFVTYFFRKILVWITLKIKMTQVRFDDKSFLGQFLKQKIEKPISWILISAQLFVIVEHLDLTSGLANYLISGVKLFLSFNVIRLCYMAAEAFGMALIEWAEQSETKFDDQLAPFASRVLKVTVVILGILVGLQNFGVNVTALLAGLGIGGVAIAFAAQDTVANVFGTITIILDRPFKLGDHIKIGETEGTIEEVGFRSTRIRTFYNSLVSLPNSIVAKEKIDNLTLRNGWIRFRHVVGFTYDASIKQIREFAEELHYLISQTPHVDKNRIIVHFNSFGDSSLNVLVNFHFLQKNDESLIKLEEEFLELVYDTAKKHNLEFAFPTRTIQIADSKNLNPGKTISI